jgi:hypothetical protein
MAKEFRKRPSEIVNITDPLVAYQFDRAVMYFGQAYEADIEDATRDSKSQSQAQRSAQVVVDRWLRDDEVDMPREQPEKPAKQFRDPAEIFAERKKQRANGQL